jgi:hypothetical protein
MSEQQPEQQPEQSLQSESRKQLQSSVDPSPRASESQPKGGVGKGKISAIASTVLWTLGFGLCFVIPAKSTFSWVADFFLLLGFFPLLYLYPAGWPWLIFGVLNFAIGAVLEIGYQIPASYFTPEVNKMRIMLQGTHPTLVWLLVGVACAIFGIFRMVKNTIIFFRKRRTPRAEER